VNLEHLRAFLWLRWRLRYNQFRRAGALNAVFFSIYAVLAFMASIGLFVTGLMVGLFAMPEAPAAVRLYVWDGVVIVFLFFWMIGLLMEVQRAEGLALDKVLHLPVSPAGGFLINYLSSLFSLTLIAFVPGMVGLILGQSISISPVMLLGLPLLTAFILALTAVTYQFQGWLASLMVNQRRRRTVIVAVTAGFILVSQLPNLINVIRPWEDAVDSSKRLQEQRTELQRDFAAKKMTLPEYQKKDQELQKEHDAQNEESNRRQLAELERITRVVNLVLPIGWFPLGAATLPDGVLPALLGTLGLGLIGAFSLRRAYRTTVRLYTGQFTSGSAASASTAPTPAPPWDPNKVRLVERTLPWVSEHASAVATAAFRSLTRAPEAKMMLLAPIIMVVVFGGVLMTRAGSPPEALRPLMAIGAATMIVLMSVQLIGNQFGYDRAGFRAYVLCPSPRREILLGKNLAFAPLVLGFGFFALLLIGTVYPMRIDHYPAAIAQLISMFLVFCMLANVLSIFAPIAMAAGSVQPQNVKMVPVLLQLVFLMFFPVALVPVLLPIGVEVLVEEVGEVRGLPVSLVLSLIILTVVVFVYRRVLTWQGEWLEAREQKILEVVTSKAE